MSSKQYLLAAISITIVGLALYGKYKLATAKPTLLIIALGALVFAASTPAKAE